MYLLLEPFDRNNELDFLPLLIMKTLLNVSQQSNFSLAIGFDFQKCKNRRRNGCYELSKYFQIQIVAKSLNDVFVLVHVRCKRTFIDTQFLSYTKIQEHMQVETYNLIFLIAAYVGLTANIYTIQTFFDILYKSPQQRTRLRFLNTQTSVLIHAQIWSPCILHRSIFSWRKYQFFTLRHMLFLFMDSFLSFHFVICLNEISDHSPFKSHTITFTYTQAISRQHV